MQIVEDFLVDAQHHFLVSAICMQHITDLFPIIFLQAVYQVSLRIFRNVLQALRITEALIQCRNLYHGLLAVSSKPVRCGWSPNRTNMNKFDRSDFGHFYFSGSGGGRDSFSNDPEAYGFVLSQYEPTWSYMDPFQIDFHYFMSIWGRWRQQIGRSDGANG